MQRVVVTGVGAVTPIGLSAPEFGRFPLLFPASHGSVRLTRRRLRFRSPPRSKASDPKNYMDFKASRRMDRYSQLAVAASGEAIKATASLSLDGDNTYRIGVMMNTGGGGIQTLTREVQVYYNKGANRVSPFFIPMFVQNMAACQVSIIYGIQGPVLASVAACAAGMKPLRLTRCG